VGSQTLFSRADFRETLAQRLGQTGLYFGSNQAHTVEILDVDLVFEPETSELHVNQVGDRGDQDAFFGAQGFGGRNGLKIIRADLFADEEQMYRSPGSRLVHIHEHVNPTDVSEPKSVFFRSSDDCQEIAAVNRCIYISGKSRLVWLAFGYVYEGRKASYDPVRYPCGA